MPWPVWKGVQPGWKGLKEGGTWDENPEFLLFDEFCDRLRVLGMPCENPGSVGRLWWAGGLLC